MSQDDTTRIGLIIGREQDWPEAFMKAVNERDAGVVAELVKIGGTFMGDDCDYQVIIDRMSHEIPYYRTFLKYVAMHGTYVINDPFVWSSDSRFFGTALANHLGYRSPRTVVLPNKEVEAETVPDSFRNLVYPMDWQAIVDYVGVPAIFKDAVTGGRRLSFRVHSVEELIQRYDESGTRTMILQEVVDSGDHIHCFVIGQQKVLPLRFSMEDNRYHGAPDFEQHRVYGELVESALAITRAYGYDINMLEFLVEDDHFLVVNGTNPSPVLDRSLLEEPEFAWLVNQIASLAIERAQNPPPQRITFSSQTIA